MTAKIRLFPHKQKVMKEELVFCLPQCARLIEIFHEPIDSSL